MGVKKSELFYLPQHFLYFFFTCKFAGSHCFYIQTCKFNQLSMVRKGIDVGNYRFKDSCVNVKRNKYIITTDRRQNIVKFPLMTLLKDRRNDYQKPVSPPAEQQSAIFNFDLTKPRKYIMIPLKKSVATPIGLLEQYF